MLTTTNRSRSLAPDSDERKYSLSLTKSCERYCLEGRSCYGYGTDLPVLDLMPPKCKASMAPHCVHTPARQHASMPCPCAHAGRRERERERERETLMYYMYRYGAPVLKSELEYVGGTSCWWLVVTTHWFLLFLDLGLTAASGLTITRTTQVLMKHISLFTSMRTATR